jgi:thioredoxin 1
MSGSKDLEAEFFVACLCAEWCGTCREYQPGFDALRERFPEVGFQWVDVEDDPDIAGDVDVDNFPTLVIQRGNRVLFCGPMLPQLHLLQRLIETFLEQSEEDSHAYVNGNAERRSWQDIANIRSRSLEAK